jgi:hypothetical protein
MSRRTIFRLASLLAAIAAIFGLSLAPASAATGPDGFPIMYASEGGYAHNCTVIGSDQYGNQAVICADLLSGPSYDIVGDPIYPYYTWAGVEAYCQNSSDVIVQCAQINEDVSIADAVGDVGYDSQTCGHSYGACPSGRYTLYTSADGSYFTYYNSDDCATNPDSEFDAWSVVWGGGITYIELPQSDKTVYLGTGNANDGENESNGHYYQCF